MVGVTAVGELHAMELEEDHCEEHDFTFILALILVVRKVEIHNAGSIDTKAACQLAATAKSAVGLDDVVQGGVLKLALEGQQR